MPTPHSLSVADLHRALQAAAEWLATNREAINAINVYPVPDGDTGTNMTLTLRGAVEAAHIATDIATAAETDTGIAALPSETHSDDATLSGYATRLTRGALFAARGNSGVILSQMLRGLAESLGEQAAAAAGDPPTIDPAALASALTRAATTAEAAVSDPIEGTMLTVMRDAAASASAAAAAGGDLASVLTAAEAEAYASTDRTPTLLATLRDAGVVDAGGLGLAVILSGLRAACLGEPLPPPLAWEAAPPPATSDPHADAYGYCCEFIITGEALDRATIEAAMRATDGTSLLVVGDQSALHVHIHAADPGPALSAGAAAGALESVKIDNMQSQHRDWAEARGVSPGGASPDGAPSVAQTTAQTTAPPTMRPDEPAARAEAIALVAVAAGAGLKQAFAELGATVVDGGPTANPSAGDLLSAARATGAAHVLLLPNDPNVVMAARQAAASDPERLLVVPTRSIPAGLAAAIAFTPHGEAATIAANMAEAAGAIRTIAVTRAIREATVDGTTVRSGDALALLDGRLCATAATEADALAEACRCIAEAAGDGDPELVTVYLGRDVPPDAAGLAQQAIAAALPGAEIEVLPGGQPHYSYLVGVE